MSYRVGSVEPQMQNGSPMLHSILSRYLPDGRAGSGFLSFRFFEASMSERFCCSLRSAQRCLPDWSCRSSISPRTQHCALHCRRRWSSTSGRVLLPFLSEAATETIGGVTAEQSAVSRAWFFGAALRLRLPAFP